MIRTIVIVLLSASLIAGCTKLNEEFKDALPDLATSGGTPNIDALLQGVYNSLQTTFQDQANVFALEEMTTDEMVGPTRGPDWDDNGAWRVLHAHRWDADNVHLRDVFNQLLGTSFAATDLLRFDSTSAKASQARFLRAFVEFLVLDGYDQVPYRDPGETTLEPARVRKGLEELDHIISEVNIALTNLPDGPAPGVATKDAAKVLLMKCYLNKGVYANRAAPTFDASDMQQVISLANDLIGSGKYPFASDYFDNFAPDNTNIGTENIWSQKNDAGVSGSFGSTVRSRWHTVMHYNQNRVAGTALQPFLTFMINSELPMLEEVKRIQRLVASNPGQRVNVGFYIGQQYNWADDAKLSDRGGAPLIFTRDVALIEVGDNLEVTGIRPNKFPIDYVNDNSGNVDNDYPFFRISDVMLMKAEAMLRTSDAAGALTIMNSIRSNRKAIPLASATLDNLLDERGLELYLEGWRRQDMIRFWKIS